MKLLIAAAAVLATVTPQHRAHRVYGRGYTVSSTAYSACDSSTTTADSGLRSNPRRLPAHWGWVANNFLPFGTKIHVFIYVHGRKDFEVHDHIGWGSQLDFFMPCDWVDNWGRRTLAFRTYRIVYS